MTVATGEVIRNPSPRGLKIRQSRPSEVYNSGWLVGRRRGSALCEVPVSTAPRADLIIEGYCDHVEAGPFTASSTTDSGGGAIDAITRQPQNIRIVTATSGWFDTGTSTHQITAAHIGLSAYAFDNNTVYLDDLNGQLPRAGTIDRVDERGKVSLIFDNKADEFSGSNTDTAPLNLSVRNVITALGAYTASGGTITVTATGALGTQDTTITNVAGDEVWLPEYAGTANSSVTVSAANSGPYEVVNPGGTGVNVVLRRPVWWAHGATMPLGAQVKVAEGSLFGRTTWDVGAAKGSVIGTDDPSAYPRSVTQTVTLTSSAKAIANVPIRAAGSQVLCRLSAVGGTTTNTVGYGTLVDPTPGPIGTATTTVNALASGMSKNGTADTSNVVVTIFN